MGTQQVETVLGPVDVDRLGAVDAHDHLFMRSPAMAGDELEDLDKAIEEVREGADSGLRTIVDMTPIGLGRRPDLLRRVAEAAGVHVVAASGFHRDAHYPAGHWVHEASVERLTEVILADLRDGMHPTDGMDPDAARDPARAGAIKGGASYHHATPSERRRLEAIANAARETGVAALIHTENGTFGHEVVDLLEGWGLPPDRVLLAHLDRNPDPDLHVEIAARGVTLEYDTVGRTKYHPDSTVLGLIEAVARAGHLDRLALGIDTARPGMMRSHGGGPGLRYLMDRFVPRIRQRLGHDAVHRILVANPARVFGVAA